MSSSALNAIPVVYTALARFRVNIEPLQIVVEVHRPSAQVSSQQGCVSGEDGGYIDASLLRQRQGDAGQPFVKVRDDGFRFLVAYVLGPLA